ncbi:MULTISPECIES: nitrate/nitrite two-component system sensor histidine kinase NarX [unclassified Gilliamella]|uniref:nitrate/nitrite two-component system sensor histidine kinase NarX n=1 Tax=unclassified Gilliamella TaxID=2685620 RepID=UPI002269E252|nr:MULTISPECIES: nitrate/nitrite two-component system sensor histidine kinase NarX [unclassified Gilliamella]MCX8574216.1 nitrate/nitrite two-component system sensor histidine kinase NarX [Gilliamella sp. B3831]MCX8576447.1 nitrate/nitrite two-component system sensor histidine kinase NarX [Gilliamella sp. B3815]MCX8590948.1 nitrate/nitrite two-component system sensor histidine kinase NarX [Gilliamella sp. B3812]MCX8603666.1 nitrate/nitrite two-component system sensor histidine kinase NarX [Gill
MLSTKTTNNKTRYHASIINRLSLLMCFLGTIALIALSLSIQVANDTKGSAYMINQLGLIRMKSYQLLSMVPLNKHDNGRLNIFSEITSSKQQLALFERYDLIDEFNELHNKWRTEIAIKIAQAKNIDEIKTDIDQFVIKTNYLVHKIDQKTENQIHYISRLQQLFIIIIVVFLIAQIYYLRRYLLAPWRKLINMAQAISKHNFSERFPLRSRKNEFDLLGLALNNMSDQIESQYLILEERVAEKTAELQQTNNIISFQYHATKQLHTSKPLCERFLMILRQLEELVPLTQFQIRFYESENPEHYQQISYDNEQKLPFCQNPHCCACLTESKHSQQHGFQRYWYLQDNGEKYGILFAIQPTDVTLSDEQENLITGLIEQMSTAMMLDRQIEQQKQYLLMKERSAMARELHDSIAQSLSCLKIHLSCLQMQSDLTSQSSIDLLATMRKEVNITYSQLRELITSFRLRLNQTGFYASLMEMIEEFNQKLKFNIQLEYQLPLNIIKSKHAFHLLQFIREALNNVYKHAQASHVIIALTIDDNQIITVSVSDNGIGFQTDVKQDNHYGMVIMRDRAEILNGNLTINTEPQKGTQVMVIFKANKTIPFTIIEE